MASAQCRVVSALSRSRMSGDPELDAIAVRLDAIVRQLADMGLEFDNVGQLLAAGAAVSPDIRERLKALTTRH